MNTPLSPSSSEDEDEGDDELDGLEDELADIEINVVRKLSVDEVDFAIAAEEQKEEASGTPQPPSKPYLAW